MARQSTGSSGGGKGKTAGRGKGTKSVSKTSRAQLQFPVGRIGRFLKKGRYAPAWEAAPRSTWRLSSST